MTEKTIPITGDYALHITSSRVRGDIHLRIESSREQDRSTRRTVFSVTTDVTTATAVSQAIAQVIKEAHEADQLAQNTER